MKKNEIFIVIGSILVAYTIVRPVTVILFISGVANDSLKQGFFNLFWTGWNNYLTSSVGVANIIFGIIGIIILTFGIISIRKQKIIVK